MSKKSILIPESSAMEEVESLISNFVDALDKANEAVEKSKTLLESEQSDAAHIVATNAIEEIEDDNVALNNLLPQLGVLYCLKSLTYRVNEDNRDDMLPKAIQDTEMALQYLTAVTDPDEKAVVNEYIKIIHPHYQELKRIESGSRCFIATATYGSALAPEVVTLRQFRDTYLKYSHIGVLLIRVYEHCSPPLAQWLSRHEFWRRLVRQLIVTPAAKFAHTLDQQNRYSQG